MVVLTSGKGEGRRDDHRQTAPFHNPQERKAGGEIRTRVDVGLGEGCWGAWAGELQLGVAAGAVDRVRVGTNQHLPDTAATRHLPTKCHRYPRYIIPTRLSLIQADPIPPSTGTDLPWGWLLLWGEYHRVPTQIPHRAHCPPHGGMEQMYALSQRSDPSRPG